MYHEEMIIRLASYALALVGFLSACTQQPTAPLVVENNEPDGLQRVATKYFNAGFVRPNVDFSRYKGVLIDESELAFKTPDRSKQQFPLTDEQKLRLRQLLDEQFATELDNLKNLHISDVPGPDVLDLRVRVQDILATVPPQGVGQAGWGGLFLEALGEATLVIELRDSESEEVLARVFDRRALEGTAIAQQGAAPVTRWQDVEKISMHWATTVRKRLDVLVSGKY
jgi:hypothetical protein